MSSDPPRYPDTGDDGGIGDEPTTGTSPWVYVLLSIGVLVVVVVVALHLAGVMGPGSH